MIQMYGLNRNNMLIFKKVTSRVIRCHQMSTGKEGTKGKVGERQGAKGRNTHPDNAIGRNQCRAEGTEVPYFSWNGYFPATNK